MRTNQLLGRKRAVMTFGNMSRKNAPESKLIPGFDLLRISTPPR
jgi:hypothetical protein